MATDTTARPGTLLTELVEAVLGRLDPELRTLRLERATLGIFFTGVKLDNGAGGLCATPVKSVPEAVCCPSSASALPIPGKIAGRLAVDVLDDLARPQDLRRALALATLNALVETLWRRDGPPDAVETLEGDAFDALPVAPDDRVVLVGAFPPYMRRLRQGGQRFNVLEMDPGTLRPDELPHYVPADRAAEVIPHADVLVATGTTLLNGSIDGELALLRHGAEAAIIGPTTTLLAEPYRRRGVTVVGGTRVLAPDDLLDLLAEGGSGYHIFGTTVSRTTLRLTP